MHMKLEKIDCYCVYSNDAKEITKFHLFFYSQPSKG